MKKTLVALTMTVMLFGTAACGSDTVEAESQAPVDAPTAQVLNEPKYTENEVRKVLGVDKYGWVTTPAGAECEAAVVMTDANSVNMYADAGDTVVTNPDGTVGVKVVEDKEGLCTLHFMDRLSTLN